MAIYKKGNHWHVDFYDANNKRVRKSTGTADKDKAQELHDKLKSQSWDEKKMGAKPIYIWEQAVIRWLTEQAHKRSLIDDKRHLTWLHDHLTGLPLEQITKTKIDVIKQSKSATGVSNATVNRMVAVVRSILARAVKEWEWLDKVPHVRMLPEPQTRIRWLTQEEAELLLNELPEHLEAMARFSLATGLRASNVTKLEWSQVDMLRRCAWIHADQSKAGKSIAVPLNDDALAVLRRQIGKRLVRVFTYNSKSVDVANTRAWRNALKRAEIDNFRWHDLRHTWASWHVQGGTPLNVLKELGGWVDLKMVLRYAHLSNDNLLQYANITKIGMIDAKDTFQSPSKKFKRIK